MKTTYLLQITLSEDKKTNNNKAARLLNEQEKAAFLQELTYIMNMLGKQADIKLIMEA